MSDFTKVTLARASVEKVLEPPTETKNVEERLIRNHRLRHRLGQVRYHFNPLLLRGAATDFQALANSICNKYGFQFQTPDIVKHAAIQSAHDPMAPTPNERLRQVFDSRDGLSFLDGVLNYPDPGKSVHRAIRIANLHSQNLTVTVDGTTREAEYVALQIASDLLEFSGVESGPEAFLNSVAGLQYRTTTQQDLGALTEFLLAPPLRVFVAETVEAQLGWRMGVLPTAPEEKEKQKEAFEVRCAFHNLSFSVSVFDRESGNADDDIELDIRITDRRFHGSDVVTISSQLSYDNHLRLVSELIRAVESASGEAK